MKFLIDLRTRLSIYMIGFLWVNALIGTSLAVLMKATPNYELVVASCLLALAPTLAMLKARSGAVTRYTTAIALALYPALFLVELQGHPYQGDMHMVFFAYLAISAGWVDEGAILAAAATIAVHHLVLNFAQPALVFAGGQDFMRVLLHALIVVVQTAALVMVVIQLKYLVAKQDEQSAALAEKQATEILAIERDASMQLISESRETLLEAVGQFRNAIAERLNTVSQEAASTTRTAHDMERIAASALAGSEHVTAMAQSSRTNITAIAATIEELVLNSNEITNLNHKAGDQMRTALTQSEDARTDVQNLNNASDSITRVIDLIRSIAKQTNLLALNATIEAARAGEHGRGFSVVAAEVKELAAQTAQATTDIEIEIVKMQAGVIAADQSIGRIGGEVRSANAAFMGIVSVLEQQGLAIQEMSRNVQDIASASGQLADHLSSAQSAARETKNVSKGTSEAMLRVASTADDVKLEVDRFLTSIATA